MRENGRDVRRLAQRYAEAARAWSDVLTSHLDCRVARGWRERLDPWLAGCDRDAHGAAGFIPAQATIGARDAHGAAGFIPAQATIGARDAQAAFCRQYVRAVVCAAMAIGNARERLGRPALDWLLRVAEPLCREVLIDALACRGFEHAFTLSRRADTLLPALLDGQAGALPEPDHPQIDPVVGPELLLARLDRGQRAARGFYVTPAPLARFVVAGVDRLLRDGFGLADGLADITTWNDAVTPAGSRSNAKGAWTDAPLVRILDPAAGSGAFLVAAIMCIHEQLQSRCRSEGCSEVEAAARWSDYVGRHLLPRLAGIELLPAAAVCAHLTVAEALARTGFDFAHGARLRLYVADTLAPPDAERQLFAAGPPQEHAALVRLRGDEPFTVVIGNPPFLAAALPGHRWIERLLKGRGPGGEPLASYYEAEGRPLDEKKLWLHDDYVKFFRYAQWRIERAGCGVVGLVTNHGYLDNATFRGMREKLLQAFPRITIVDLHGNLKKKEQPPAGRTDENVFSIAQGTAVALLEKPRGDSPPRESPLRESAPEVAYAELWGSRDEKLAALGEPQRILESAAPIAPSPPHYFFTPRDDRLAAEYERGWKLTELMPVSTTAPVTARDGFVVAFDEGELLARIGDFRNLQIPDGEIRERYFRSTRSVRFAPGDTRGWKLAEARRRVAEDAAWRQRVRDCLYRPFDRRKIYWAEWMIDWPRPEVMRHLEPGDNLALVARRQMPPGEPCTYFWITREIALDGVIRSDNRGSESLFPLFLVPQNGGARRTNLSETFLAELERRCGLQCVDAARGDLSRTVGGEDVLAYVYALFHSSIYRTRYAELLRIDFPRVFLPADASLFHRLSAAGRRLIALHTMTECAETQADSAQQRSTAELICTSEEIRPVVESGYPRHAESRVLINRHTWFSGVSTEVWNFRAGGHQVCRKWLKDRRGRELNQAEVDRYEKMIAAIAETLSIMRAIDDAVESAGGWQTAFGGR